MIEKAKRVLSMPIQTPSPRDLVLPTAAVPPVGGTRFDLIMALLSAWMIAGLYIDGWSHMHLHLETYFSRWHAMFYSGSLAMALFTGLTILRSARGGTPWGQVLPRGYGKTLVGLVLYIAGGMGDMVWHTLFGLERSVEALVSPTHLLIFVGLGLTVSGPFRAAWQKFDDEDHSLTLWSHLPRLLSLTLLWSVLTFVTLIVHPFVGAHAGLRMWTIWAAYGPVTLENAQIGGISGIVIQTGIFMGLLLLTIVRWQIPFGSITFILTTNMVFVSLLGDQYLLIPFILLSGLGTDLLLTQLQPSIRRVGAYRLFAFAVPVLIYAGYFLGLKAKEGLAWSTQVIMGSIVLAGLTGWLVSYLVLPPSGNWDRQLMNRRHDKSTDVDA